MDLEGDCDDVAVASGCQPVPAPVPEHAAEKKKAPPLLFLRAKLNCRICFSSFSSSEEHIGFVFFFVRQ